MILDANERFVFAANVSIHSFKVFNVRSLIFLYTKFIQCDDNNRHRNIKYKQKKKKKRCDVVSSPVSCAIQ